MNGKRALRACLGVILVAAWVLTDAAPWIADKVRPDYHPRGRQQHHPEVIKAYADETAREAILAGTLSIIVFPLSLWLIFGRPWRGPER